MFSSVPLPPRTRPDEPGEDEQKRNYEIYRTHNFGFERVERLDGNVGYLNIRYFAPPEWAAETAIAALNFLGNSDSLIVDLRQAGGGSPAMVGLISSFFFPNGKPVHLNSNVSKATKVPIQFWTQTYLPGKRLSHQPIFILTSNSTFSAAEEFAYNLSNMKRAVVIGESTKGGAHPSVWHRIHAHFLVSIPGGRAINPISGTNWEGVGVVPTIRSPAYDAFKIAHISALEQLLALSQGEEIDEERIKALDRLKSPLVGDDNKSS